MENKSNLSFKGAFLLNFNRTLPGTREAFEHSMGKVRGQVFENFGGKKGNTLYVLRNSKDYYAANFIKRNELKFSYMPEVNSKLQFDTYEPEKVINYINDTKPLVIRKVDELMDYIQKYRQSCKSKGGVNNPCDELLDKLKIKFNGRKVKNNKGVTTLRDDKTNGFISVSPPNAYGIYFAYVNPGNMYEYESRYAVDKQGNILARFRTPDEMLLFKKKFIEAVKHHLHQD